ncbi:MAG: sulfite exporter TauE/SafE family protein [Myxococcaceae bacterium]
MVGFLGGLLLGVVFSVLGAGGGILAVPALTLGLRLSLNDAMGAGLAVVFSAALTAAVGHGRARRVDLRTVAIVAPTLALGAIAGARLNPLLPERLTAGLFALVLLLATASLFRARTEASAGPPSLKLLAGAGLGLGVLTGVLGVGGGFLLVPALTSLGRLPLARAVGTSSALIAIGSLAGGVSALSSRPALVPLVLPLAAGAIVGALLGVPLTGALPPQRLRAAFATLSVVVALGMTVKAVRG